MNDDAPRPPDQTPQGVELNRLPWSAPWRWLGLGLRDFLRAPFIGLFYGLAFMVMGADRGFALAESLDLAVYFITRDEARGVFVDRHTSRFDHYLQPGE